MGVGVYLTSLLNGIREGLKVTFDRFSFYNAEEGRLIVSKERKSSLSLLSSRIIK